MAHPGRLSDYKLVKLIERMERRLQHVPDGNYETDDLSLLLTLAIEVQQARQARRDAQAALSRGIAAATMTLDSLISTKRQLRERGQAALDALREAQAVLRVTETGDS